MRTGRAAATLRLIGGGTVATIVYDCILQEPHHRVLGDSFVFQNGKDGYYLETYPLVLDSIGNVYGTTTYGGGGNLFELTPPTTPGGLWTKTSLYDFPTADSECGITTFDSNGNCYCVGPSMNGNDAVSEISPPGTNGGSWTERTLYVFKGVPRGQSFGDGSGPINVTSDACGNLWGVTSDGGYCQRFEGGSCFGALFVLTPPAASNGAWMENLI